MTSTVTAQERLGHGDSEFEVSLTYLEKNTTKQQKPQLPGIGTETGRKISGIELKTQK